MKKVLIFGCGGFVGYYLSKELSMNGYEVYGTDINESGLNIYAYIHSFIKGDLLDNDFVLNLIDSIKPNYIVNLAAISSVGSSWKIPQLTIDVNVKGTLNILESVRKLGLNNKILLVGSSEEYAVSNNMIGEEYPIIANNPYGISKVTQERFALIYRNEYHMNIVNTRTFNHTGIGQPLTFAIPSFVKQAANIHNSGKPGIMRVGNLDAYRDIGDVRDMVSAYRLILEKDTKETVFNVGSGSKYLLKDIVNYIISLSQQKITIHVDPNMLRPLDNPIIWCDNSKIKKELGWEPRYSVFTAIDLMFEKFVSQEEGNGSCIN